MVDALDLKSNDFFDLEGSSPLVPSENNFKYFWIWLELKKDLNLIRFCIVLKCGVEQSGSSRGS